MKFWLLIWITWQEGEVDTPWDFQLIDHTNEYRRRTMPFDKVPMDVVETTYMSLNPKTIEDFEKNHVSGVVLAAIIKTVTPEDAATSITQCFPDAEFIQCIDLPPEAVPTVLDLMQSQG